MGSWGLAGQPNACESGGLDTANSRGTTLTAAGSANTKGSWTQLIASTAGEASGIVVHIQGSGTNSADFLIDIGIGAATEEVLIPDIQWSNASAGTAGSVVFPVHVPAGSRISARIASTTASGTKRVSVTLLPVGPGVHPGFGACTAYGVVAASSAGTQVDPGGTANTKGAFTQLVASTASPIHAVVLGFGAGGDWSRAAQAHQLWDIAVGAATEQIVIPDVPTLTNTGSTSMPEPFFSGPYPVSIPAGERITARMQSAVNTAGDRVLSVVVYGFC